MTTDKRDDYFDLPRASAEEIKANNEARRKQAEERMTIFVHRTGWTFDGFVRERGERISVSEFVYGNHVDRMGHNVLDMADDPEAQRAYYGDVMFGLQPPPKRADHEALQARNQMAKARTEAKQLREHLEREAAEAQSGPRMVIKNTQLHGRLETP